MDNIILFIFVMISAMIAITDVSSAAIVLAIAITNRYLADIHKELKDKE